MGPTPREDVPRPRFGVATWIYGDAPLPETLGRIRAAGYRGVELLGEPDRWPVADVRRWLAESGLAPVALTASCMVPATPRDLAHPDPAVRGEAVRYLTRCLEFAAEIGAPLAQMLPSGEPRLRPLATREAEWGWSVEAMQAAARHAERLGVRIAIEPLNRYEAYLVTSAAEALDYLRDVGSLWVGLTLDLFHGNIEEPDPVAAIEAAGARLWHVQVADSNRQGLGRGHLDVAAIVAALRRAGYAGALVMEMMAPGPDPFAAVKDERTPRVLDGYIRESLERLRALWPESET